MARTTQSARVRRPSSEVKFVFITSSYANKPFASPLVAGSFALQNSAATQNAMVPATFVSVQVPSSLAIVTSSEATM